MFVSTLNVTADFGVVSTLSHPKVAAGAITDTLKNKSVSTLSHPKVAAKGELYPNFGGRGFNTQPPEGGCPTAFSSANQLIRFNTQPPEGGCWGLCQKRSSPAKFQHSATRRWLPLTISRSVAKEAVSTLSHPKVAA